MGRCLKGLGRSHAACARGRYREKPLRDAHRGYVAFLRRTMPAEPGSGREQAALQLCQLCGLVRESVEETNDLGEVRRGGALGGSCIHPRPHRQLRAPFELPRDV